jgi:hypothetical protein
VPPTRWRSRAPNQRPLSRAPGHATALPGCCGFYWTCLIDGLLEHSPAEHVRGPSVPPESPTLGFTHLQFEALLTVLCSGVRVTQGSKGN